MQKMWKVTSRPAASRLREPGVADCLRAPENAAELYRILAGSIG